MTLPPVHKIWVLDLLDIFLVAALFYRLLILVKGTRSAQMYVGLLIIVLVGIVARESELIAVKWIVDSLKTVWLIAFVILFQPELRHALAQFGRTRYFRSFRGVLKQHLNEGELRSELSRIFRVRPGEEPAPLAEPPVGEATEKAAG